MIIRCIDFETTGTPAPDKSEAICEIGWTDLETEFDEATGRAISARLGTPQAMLINPRRPIPNVARAVHHISDEDVADAAPVDRGFLALMDGPPGVFCAHNADFEKAFFGGGETPWVCTYKVALRLWPDAEATTCNSSATN